MWLNLGHTIWAWHMVDVMQPKTVSINWHDKRLEILNTCSDLGQQWFLLSVYPSVCRNVYVPRWREHDVRCSFCIQSIKLINSTWLRLKKKSPGLFRSSILSCQWISLKWNKPAGICSLPVEKCVSEIRPISVVSHLPALSVGNEELAPVVQRRKRSAFHVINGLHQSNQ